MSQEERNPSGRDHPPSLGEDGGRSSQHATGVPTAPGSLIGSAPSLPSGSGPGPGLRRPVTRQLAQGIQAYQQSHLGITSSRDEILRWDDGRINLFQGLTPPPLPSVMLPSKKRTIGEILGDEKRPDKDKLAQEIDKIAEEVDPAKRSYVHQAGPAGPAAAGEGPGQQKRTRLDPTPRVMPTSGETAGGSGSDDGDDGEDEGEDERGDSPGEGPSSSPATRTRDSDGNNNGSFSVSR